jgi:ABC-type transport system involved in multi-copper enzyme maturation permease subunit
MFADLISTAPANFFSAGLLPTGLLAQGAAQSNWLTPVWLLSLGIAIGFLLFLVGLAKIWIMRRIPFFNQINEQPTGRIVAGVLLSLAYLGLFVGYGYWRVGPDFFSGDLPVALAFAIPTCALLGFGAWALVSRRQIGETSSIVREGFLSWLNWFCIAMVIFAASGFVMAQVNGFGIFKPVDDPNSLVASLARLPYAGSHAMEYTIPATKPNQPHAVPVSITGSELKYVNYRANKKLSLTTIENNKDARNLVDIPAQKQFSNYRPRPDGFGAFTSDQINNLYVYNPSASEAKLEIRWGTAPIYQEVFIVPVLAIFTFGVYIGYLNLATLFPKVFAIAHSTFKTEISQPIYLLAFAIGLLFMVGSIYIPYNTFGEDIKMYKDSGLTLLRVLAIFIAIWAASKSVAAEIEGRTALTVLSKPVGRRQFILGKFSGISLAIALFFIVLGFWLMVWVAYKPLYDFRENSKGLAEWTICFQESVHLLPGIFLCFLEVLIFVAISVAISTRMGILPNFLICFAIYVLGHLTPLLVQSSSLASLDTIVVFANLIAIVFPVLNHFDVQAAITTNADVPLVYLGWAIIYTAVYGAMAMLFALVLFEDRDLA